jgi:type I restriction enzyme S subunit
MKLKTAASPLEEDSIDDEELPEGWEIKKLKDITIKVPTLKPESEPERIFGYVDISAINNKTNQIFDFKKIRGADAPSRARQSIQPNDVLFSNVRTYLRNIAIIPDDLDVQVCSTGFTVLRSNGSIEPKYLFYYTLTDDFINQVTPQQTGSQYPATTDRVVKDATIPFPPLAEQQRIVARIEALLSHVDAAGDRLSRVPAIMKRFRQAVLAAACSGRLTEEWREENPDVETSFRFLERFFKGKVEPITDLFFNDTDLPDIPESWLWIEFGKIISELKNGVYLVGPNLEPPGNPILRISSVRPGKVSFDDVKYLPDSDQYIEDYHLKDKDLLFTRYNGSLEFVGICGMVRDLQDRILLYPDKLIRVRFDQSGVMPEYAEMFFQSFNARTNIYSVIKSSAGQKGISGKDIKIQPFPLPPLAEQREIVRRVGLLFERADAVEREVAAAGRRCERLTQAVMVKAFSGML